MTPAEWQQIKEILDGALERTGPDRAAYLESRCDANLELRRHIDELIAADDEVGSGLDLPIVATPSLVGAFGPLAAGDRIGVYEILEEIGHGGMGIVYLARRAEEEFEKRVAIKVARLGMAGDMLLRRFRSERQIIASLDHPNIARLLDGGTTSDGQPYLVMEYIEGRPLLEWCEEKKLSTRQRLEIFLDVCSAVDYAHQNRIVHRDIKPANILVTAQGMPKLLDFGIAKLIAPELLGATAEETVTLLRLFTPDYASPEQVRGEPVTPASDVYASGVVLYELLTGRRPYRVSTSSAAEMIRVVCDTEPARPSSVAPRELVKHLTGDLDTIILKALRKEPERRYASGGALGEDIRRFLSGQPIEARPDTFGYRTSKFVRRHREGVAASAVAAISLTAGALALWFSLSAQRESRREGPRSASQGFATSSTTLAVLPFKPLLTAHQDAVLELGMADTLITRLSRVPGISVRPTSAVLGYSGRSTDAVRAGRDLRADAVVEGSLQRSNDRMRVSVQLVSVANGRVIWGELFDTVETDMFAVEDAIAQRVAEALTPLSPLSRARLAQRGTDDLPAYHAYLKGRYFWNRRTESDFRKAIAYFGQAITADSDYALAYAGLADCYSLLAIWGAGPPSETLTQARAAALRAVALADAPGEAHASAALVKWVYDWDWDWDGADEAFRRAIALNPSYATGYQWYAYYLASRERFGDAIVQIRRAQALDPLSVSIATDLGEILCWAGRYEDAILQLQGALEMEPNFALAHNVLGMTYLKKGRVADGVSELERALRLDDGPRMLSTVGYGYGIANRRGDVRTVEEKLRALSRKRYVSPFAFALIHAGVGESDRAFDWLERAYGERSDTMAVLRVYPLMEGLRKDRRFASLIGRVNAHAGD